MTMFTIYRYVDGRLTSGMRTDGSNLTLLNTDTIDGVKQGSFKLTFPIENDSPPEINFQLRLPKGYKFAPDIGAVDKWPVVLSQSLDAGLVTFNFLQTTIASFNLFGYYNFWVSIFEDNSWVEYVIVTDVPIRSADEDRTDQLIADNCTVVTRGAYDLEVAAAKVVLGHTEAFVTSPDGNVYTAVLQKKPYVDDIAKLIFASQTDKVGLVDHVTKVFLENYGSGSTLTRDGSIPVLIRHKSLLYLTTNDRKALVFGGSDFDGSLIQMTMSVLQNFDVPIPGLLADFQRKILEIYYRNKTKQEALPHIVVTCDEVMAKVNAVKTDLNDLRRLVSSY